MNDGAPEEAWVSEYDYPNRRASLTLATAESLRSHWSGIRRDDELSAPDGSFDVFVATGAEGSTPIVKVVAALDEDGALLNAHPDFDAAAIGSFTIWPYKVAGGSVELAHWMWWATGPIFTGKPRTWQSATNRQPEQPSLPRLSVVQGDITTVQVDAIVNAANNRMREGGGVNGAIHAAGGRALLADCIKRFPDGLATGDAGWTIAGDLPARWVIHTVGPNYNAGQTDRSLLISSYRRALEVADGLGATSIAFPLLSAGAFGWPRQDATEVAVDALTSTPTKVASIQLVANDESTFEQMRAALARWTPRRILEGVQVLHERGFQGVRIFPGMSPSGMSWRVSITERSNFEIQHGHFGLRDWDRAINYSIGAGVEFAQGSVTPTTSPDEVADMILAALPSVRADADEDYMVWFAGLMRLVKSSVDPTAALPIAYDEYFDDRDGWKVGWDTGRRYPSPPIG